MGALKGLPGLDGTEREAQTGTDETEAGTVGSGTDFDVDPDAEHPSPRMKRSDVVPARRSFHLPVHITEIQKVISGAAAGDRGDSPSDSADSERGGASPDLDLDDPAVLRHEVAGPLTYLGHAIEMLRKEIATHNCPKNQELQKLLDIADQAGRQILGVLDAAKRPPSEIPVSDPAENPDFVIIHLSDVLETMTASLSLAANAEGIRFQQEIAGDVFVRGKLRKLLEVLFNVMNNAIEILKHTDSPAISVTLRVDPNAPRGLAQIIVQDNGPGIDEKHRHKLFKKGFSAKAGQGIGLWRSRRLVHQMGGSLELVNNADRHDLEGNENMPGASSVIELPIYSKPQTE